MIRKMFLVLIGVAAMTFMLVASHALSDDSTAPPGSKKNPIKPVSSQSKAPSNPNSAKGKRGSKENPIAGSAHPRNSNSN